MRVISAAALLFFSKQPCRLQVNSTPSKPKQTQQLAPPNGGFLGEHTKEVSGGVFEKRQIRFKLTAIVIQVEVSLHILATIASSSLQSNSYFVLGDIYAASADVQCTQRQTLLSSKVKRMTPRTSSFALLDPKSSEVNGVVFELLPSIRLLPNFDGSLPQFVLDNGSVWTFGGHLKICASSSKGIYCLI